MDKSSRPGIGIIFNFTKGWLGGFYYYQNIVKALDFLEDDEKPKIVIFYNKDYSDYLDDIKYPYLELVPWEFTNIYKGYLISFLTRENVFVRDMISQYGLAGIYPVNDNPVQSERGIRQGTIGAAWFPDLQHKFFPQFFEKKRLWLRELRLKITLKNTSDLVVSSNDTVNHFKQFYNIPASVRMHVLHFVSILDTAGAGKIEDLKKTYHLPSQYFIVSNAFLKHKNHLIVLKALNILKINKVHIVFTGRMEVYEDGLHINMLKSYIADNSLQNNISLLGIIPREDQLCIMNHARAVLQPSLFEGWNTTIEDAKSLGLPVIASSIAVHKEQLGNQGFYFNPEDENELAGILINFSLKSKPDYGENKERIKLFARSFLKVFQLPDR